MTELMEAVAFGMISDPNIECPFSHDEPGKVENDLDSGGGGAKLGTRLKNGWSTQLWASKNGTVEPKKKQVLCAKSPKEDDCPDDEPVKVKMDLAGGEEEFPYSVSAHHLTPAEAALPKSALIEYVKEGDVVDGDIGYDVNGSENGVWLPAHHALSSNMPTLAGASGPSKYGALSKEGDESASNIVDLYTRAVMDKTNRQFHDAHEDYSDFVVKTLDKIHVDILLFESKDCDDCKSNSGKLPAPHQLVGRLNGVSQRVETHLLGGPMGWKDPLFTSPHAKAYKADTMALMARGKL